MEPNKPIKAILIERINLLRGLSKEEIFRGISENDYLMPGAKEFLDWLNQHGIISILNYPQNSHKT
jgi:phosphoserine phosphatase